MIERRTPLILSLALLAVLSSPFASSAAAEVTETEIKAAMLLNFARFVEWPAGAETAKKPFTLGIYGRDPFGRTLDDLVKDKTIQGRPVAVARLRDLGELAAAEVVYVPQSEEAKVPEVLGVLRRASTLTVSDARGFTGLGGMIGLISSGERIRFQVNAAAAEKVGLKVSSKLQRLAAASAGQP